eukprot:scaffold65928_cov42-Tisochrysis_lutea.AAC.2
MGASVSASHRREESLLLSVCEGEAAEVASLLEEGVDVDAFDDEGSRPLHLAVALGRQSVIEARGREDAVKRPSPAFFWGGE